VEDDDAWGIASAPERISPSPLQLPSKECCDKKKTLKEEGEAGDNAATLL
jgi:hypothetical protein